MNSSGPYEPLNDFADPTAQSADQAKKSLSRVADDATVAVTDNVRDIRQQATPLINRATKQASALAHRGVDTLRDTSQRLRETALRASDNSVKYIKEEPVKSVLMAAAAGAVLTALVRRMSRSRDHG